MASAELSRSVEKVVGYPPLSELGDLQRREFHDALLEAGTFEDLPGQVAGGDPRRGAEPGEAAFYRQRRLGIVECLSAGGRSRRTSLGSTATAPRRCGRCTTSTPSIHGRGRSPSTTS